MNDQFKLNDPDFDTPESAPTSPPCMNVPSSIPPKTIFLFGAGLGVLVLCTIGFFILLGIML